MSNIKVWPADQTNMTHDTDPYDTHMDRKERTLKVHCVLRSATELQTFVVTHIENTAIDYTQSANNVLSALKALLIHLGKETCQRALYSLMLLTAAVSKHTDIKHSVITKKNGADHRQVHLINIKDREKQTTTKLNTQVLKTVTIKISIDNESAAFLF